ncbi:membrane protein [Vibrio metoecus]|uniref:Membrane protein n=1 Tax=Vibrio metoecus TaxID=1481663 RepID=A0A067B8T6_VIBMT|nr:hypothetical protein VCJ_000057 [Vibrio metoecus]KDO14764.1 membrane protein [Vibrio metoecus]KQA19142.1 membrane protein [Vibrio metoecus]KQA22345.1 membrane protein [Vibrio metoecus]KQA27642.1 membrane protein [Vibrio metoecus]
MLLLCYVTKEVAMEQDLKFALVIVAITFTALISFGVIAITH